jgi:hypothetical protein
MRVSPWLAIAVLSSACAAPAATGHTTTTDAALEQSKQKTSTDPDVTTDAAAMADFKKRVDEYVDMHKTLAMGDAKPGATADPAKISATKAALAARMQATRVKAQQGDIFTPAIRPVFRRLLTPELKGEDGGDTKDVLKDDAPPPSAVPFKVNAQYPEKLPLPTVPANVLLALPALPAPLEYRIVGRHVLLLDTTTDLVVDYLLNVIPA